MFDPKTQTPVGDVWQDEAGNWYKTVRVDDQTVMSVKTDPPEKAATKKSTKESPDI